MRLSPLTVGLARKVDSCSVTAMTAQTLLVVASMPSATNAAWMSAAQPARSGTLAGTSLPMRARASMGRTCGCERAMLPAQPAWSAADTTSATDVRMLGKDRMVGLVLARTMHNNRTTWLQGSGGPNIVLLDMSLLATWSSSVSLSPAARRWLLAVSLSLTGCATFPPRPPTPERAREFILHQTLPAHVDLIIVHGCPVRADGEPSTCNKRRARAAVDAWRRGLAPTVLFTGGAVLNRYPEAEATARHAETLGLPKSAILVEIESHHTVTNLSVARGIMVKRGMKTALLVSEAMHLVWAKQLAAFYKMPVWLWPDDPLPPYTDAYLRREPFDEYEPWKTQTTAYGRPAESLREATPPIAPQRLGAELPRSVAVIIVPDRTSDLELWGPLVDQLIATPGVQVQIFPWSKYDALPHSARRLALFVDAWTRQWNGDVQQIELVAYGAGGIVAAAAASKFHAATERPVRVHAVDAPLEGRKKFPSDWSGSRWRAFLWALNGTIRGYAPPAEHVSLVRVEGGLDMVGLLGVTNAAAP